MSDYVGNRVSTRIPCRLRIKLKAKKLKEKLYRTTDISVGGVFVPSKTAPELGLKVEVKLYLPYSKTPLLIEGKILRIKWAGNFKHIEGFAIEFRKMDRDSEDIYLNFLNRIMQEDL